MRSLDELVLPPGAAPLGLLSSDEFMPAVADFDRRLLELSGPKVGLVLCADHKAAPHSARLGVKHFESLGAHPFVLDLHADEEEAVDLVYIGGGNPAELLKCMHERNRWKSLKKQWREGATALAGSSAGAMMLCTNSLVPGPNDKVPTRWTTTVGVLDGVAVAVHASSREAEWLLEIAHRAPVHVLALDDATGVIITQNGNETIGNGRVWFV